MSSKPVSSKPKHLAFRAHDHRLCIENAVTTARELCEARGARLTPLRAQVLQLVWQSHRPLGAYAILEQLAQEQDETASKPRRLAPPTVYRALDFLQEHGLVHRLSSLNAFIGCQHPHEHHHSQFLICRSCHTVVEIADSGINEAIHAAAARAHFSDDGAGVEITGRCPGCRDA